MLTPREIKDKQFTKAVFGGYDMASVDDFLEEVEESVEKLYKENSVLKSKMKMLVDKIEEYRASEDSMRMTLVAAKKTSDGMVDEAKKKSTAMMEEAEAKSRAMLAAAEKKSGDIVSVAEAEAGDKLKEIDAKVYNEDLKLQAAKKRTEEYTKSVERLINENLEFLKKLDELAAGVPAPMAKPAEAAVQPQTEEKKPVEVQETKPVSFEESIFESAEKNIEKNETEPAVTKDLGDTKLFKLDSKDIWDDVDEPTSPHPKFDFSDLRFGSNYFSDEDKK